MDSTLLLCAESRQNSSRQQGVQQPYTDSNSGIVITADAILDNQTELFEQLGIAANRRGTIFDYELILLAYHKWGVDSPRYLIGDFAFVIWDPRERTLFGARDWMGTRSLYITHNNERVAFSTTMRPLLQLPGVRRTLRESWLSEYLAIPTVQECVDTRSTVYADIEQIPPAHRFIVKNGQLTISQYGMVEADRKLRLKSNAEYEEAFREVFDEAVRSRLRTDHSVGAMLSGGLDSGSVVSIAARELEKSGNKLHTFSYIPPHDFVDWTRRSRVADERPYIQETVRHVGNISDHYLDFAGKSSLTEMDEWLQLLESPYKFVENSFWVKEIKKYASEQGVRTMLTGAGGNFTISYGWALDYYVHLFRRFRLLKLHRELKQYGPNVGVGRKRLVRIISRLSNPWNSKEESEFPAMIHPDFARSTQVYERMKTYDVGIGGFSSEFTRSRQRFFNDLIIPSTQGVVGTKLGLRYGVIERDPTYDMRVIRFCLSLPNEQFVQNGLDRALIRRSMNQLLPDKVRLNQRIRGVQGSDWVHRMLPAWNEFINQVEQMCKSDLVAGLLNMDQIRTSLANIRNNPCPQLAIDPDMKIVMRSLVVYRFLSRNAS